MATCPLVSDYYRQQAAECIAIADATASPRTRCIMLDLAKRWAEFADVRARSRGRPRRAGVGGFIAHSRWRARSGADHPEHRHQTRMIPRATI